MNKKKIINALLFHGISLLLIIIGIIHQQLSTNDITITYWMYICWVPMVCSVIGINEIFSDFHYLGKPPFVKPLITLQGFSCVKTFRLFYRDAWWLQKIILWFALFFCLMGTTLYLKTNASFPLLWFMVSFYVYMICRYLYILHKISSTGITVTHNALTMPIFGLTKMHPLSIPWNSIIKLEIIGDALLLNKPYKPSQSLEENIIFIRGLIIHYKKDNKEKICVLTDTMLGSVNEI